jgi:hypothetical protein
MIFVSEVRQTCQANPSQWEGLDGEGKTIYARYRWGRLSVERDESEVFSKQLGDELHGRLTFEELKHATSGHITWPETCSRLD